MSIKLSERENDLQVAKEELVSWYCAVAMILHAKRELTWNPYLYLYISGTSTKRIWRGNKDTIRESWQTTRRKQRGADSYFNKAQWKRYWATNSEGETCNAFIMLLHVLCALKINTFCRSKHKENLKRKTLFQRVFVNKLKNVKGNWQLFQQKYLRGKLSCKEWRESLLVQTMLLLHKF